MSRFVHNMTGSIVSPLCALVRFSLLDLHWGISTGKQRGPVSRKPSIPLLHLPLLRRRSPSQPCGHLATQARIQVGTSHSFIVVYTLRGVKTGHKLSFLICSFMSFCFGSAADGMTQTVELNALCMKLGKKPMYKPIDPYPGMRPPNFNYNIRAPGPYQRSMQQWVSLRIWKQNVFPLCLHFD